MFDIRCRSEQARGATLTWTHLQACCVECRIALTAQELATLISSGSDQTGNLSPRLRRIQQGYCARRGCTAYFYEIRFNSDHANAEHVWDEISQQVTGRVLSESNTEDALSSAVWRAAFTRYTPRELATVLGVLLTFALVLWWNLRTPAWATRATLYKPDPINFDKSISGLNP